jgi:hypothetical protein
LQGLADPDLRRIPPDEEQFHHLGAVAPGSH